MFRNLIQLLKMKSVTYIEHLSGTQGLRQGPRSVAEQCDLREATVSLSYCVSKMRESMIFTLGPPWEGQCSKRTEKDGPSFFQFLVGQHCSAFYFLCFCFQVNTVLRPSQRILCTTRSITFLNRVNKFLHIYITHLYALESVLQNL